MIPTTVTVDRPEPVEVPPATVTVTMPESVARWIAEKLYYASGNELGVPPARGSVDYHPYYAFKNAGLHGAE